MQTEEAPDAGGGFAAAPPAAAPPAAPPSSDANADDGTTDGTREGTRETLQRLEALADRERVLALERAEQTRRLAEEQKKALERQQANVILRLKSVA